MSERIKQTINNLTNNGFKVKYFEDAASAKEAILKDIGVKESVGFGGSITVRDLNIYEALKTSDNNVFWTWKTEDKDERKVMALESSRSDVYITGCNAITESGSLINIDGTGNRISSMLYGHKQVIMVAGINKLTGTYEEAILRIKNQASGQNARRLGLDTPCAKLDKCMNCDSPQRICNATLIIERQPSGVPITIYLFNESMGY